MELTVKEIAHLLGGEVQGRDDLKVNTIAKIEEAKAGAISFLANPKYEPHIYTTQATAVIVNKTFEAKKEIQSTLVRVEDAYSAFSTLMNAYQQYTQDQKKGVEQPSFIDATANLGDDIYVGAFAYIGANVTIGKGCKIYPHAYIGDQVELGDHTVIHAGVKLYSHTKVGKHCVIHAGTVIGSDGFGFAPQEDGSYKAIPQLGNVVIEDYVDIGANTVIDCATMGSTIIKEGAKLDNLIQVAHNVEIGENTAMAAQSGVSGSSKIGKNCIIAGQVGVAGHLQLADGVKIAAQSGISKSITKENTAVMGSPAFDIKHYFKSAAVFKKLPELQRRVSEVEKKIFMDGDTK
ncbi:MAG: UDP-3-O-(3-hydroxymyristoyl)glucosamine N-acyltransferase [Flammeovirgaceae bacterium]